jgi:two-component system LytT family response regulator
MSKKKLKKRLLIPLYGDKYVLIKISKIVYCQADGHYTYYYMKDGTKYISSKPLKVTQDLLYGKGFYRISRSLLINLNHLERYDKMGKVMLTGEVMFPVSVRKQTAFHRYLSEVHFTLT